MLFRNKTIDVMNKIKKHITPPPSVQGPEGEIFSIK